MLDSKQAGGTKITDKCTVLGVLLQSGCSEEGPAHPCRQWCGRILSFSCFWHLWSAQPAMAETPVKASN